MAERRLNALSSHFRFPKATSLDECRSRGPRISKEVLRQHYLSPYFELCERLLTEMNTHPLFDRAGDFEATRAEARRKVMERLLHLGRLCGISPDSDSKDPLYKSNVTVIYSSFDSSMSIRLMVHLCLYTDSVKLLGTAKHHPHVERALRLQDIGCYCMTEIGHGTNVNGVETTATYNHSTRTFILNSPTPTAAKFWIGALAKTANKAVVFAQLYVNEVNHGVHVFLIDIRDYETHKTLPGLIIGDCGAKEGHHGIDNGFMIMKDYSAPYDALLDKFALISEDGKYKSPIKNKERRFGAMLSALSGGRVAVLGTSEAQMRNAISIAVRYAASRRQFGNPEKLLIDYELHRCRLMPLLAKTVVTRVGYQELIRQYGIVQPKIIENPECEEKGEFHATLSTAKALASWYSKEVIDACRQACGGHGYSAYNGFVRFMTDQDVQLTWEGDNNILIQQTSKYLLRVFRTMFKGHKINSPTLTFLNRTKTPFVKLTTEDITNPSRLLNLFEYRVLNCMQRSASRIQAVSAQAESQASVWNNTQVHFFHTLSLVFGELFFARCIVDFADKVGRCDQETGNVLRKLAMLYMLTIVEKDAQSIIDLVDEPTYREMQKAFRTLCWEIGDSSLNIVDAIAAPDNVLGGAIGRGDGEGMSHYLALVENAADCYELPSWVDLLKTIRTSF